MDLQDIINWMQQLSTTYGYLGIFLIALIGAASIILPIPYAIIIFILGGLKSNGSFVFEPIFIAVAAGIGSAIGEFTAYLLGMGGRRVLREKYKKKMDVLEKVFNRFGSIVIFIFALTPLPDDLLFIPLGIMRYSIIRAFIPAVLGKFLMNLIVAYSGRFSIEFTRQIFGVESDMMTLLIGIVLAIILLTVMLVIMLRLDWEKYLKKYLGPKEEGEQKP